MIMDFTKYASLNGSFTIQSDCFHKQPQPLFNIGNIFLLAIVGRGGRVIEFKPAMRGGPLICTWKELPIKAIIRVAIREAQAKPGSQINNLMGCIGDPQSLSLSGSKFSKLNSRRQKVSLWAYEKGTGSVFKAWKPPQYQRFIIQLRFGVMVKTKCGLEFEGDSNEVEDQLRMDELAKETKFPNDDDDNNTQRSIVLNDQ
ncbi:UNKNOWN [Stylonychia lemnae]|uniref:Uncharacterized protein n=1 Tax=Stylonychia lemnae TaxID=5949 RepID=A0A078ALZ6_STYLE|nr:UNKNOWN [Stylonychia lemnae]|eukprot:CDW82881.1 UNKNOWN [Stylonychia lemnae]